MSATGATASGVLAAEPPEGTLDHITLHQVKYTFEI